MSGQQNRGVAGAAIVTSSALDAQNSQNRTIYEDWQQDRLNEARAVLADIAHYPDTLVVLACRVICTHGSDPIEHADALGVSRLLGSHLPETAKAAPNGGAT
ncbi:MAG: hypothetical protein ACI92Z_000582 [Paracoccaceae bacterium]|jgi:hypothetical protein